MRYFGFRTSLVFFSLVWGAISFADENRAIPYYEWALAESKLTLEQAAEVLAGKISGQILDGKSIWDAGKEYYEFKVLTPEDGRVSFIRVDPETGEIQDS